MKTEYLPVPKDKLYRFLNRGVHLSWAYTTCVWILQKIEGESAILKIRVGKKTLVAKISDIRTTRRNEDLLNLSDEDYRNNVCK